MATDLFSENRKILTVSELTQGVKCLIEEGFPSVWVSGEMSNVSRPSSGHIYLALKDPEAQIRAVLWRSTAARLPFKLAEGQEVIARGKLTVYPPRGDYQLVIEEIQPKGIGALELALRQLKEKLSRLGYFAAERKRSLPRFPRRLALVTSPSGAAIRDMLETLRSRWPAVEVLVCPVRVQGDGAAAEIAAAIRLLNQLHAANHVALDVMIVGRGGGSTEDLWAFNEECVAHAIFHSVIPVVSAVGHEIDFTIADGVADCRALTPTDAAGRVVPDRQELLQAIQETESRLRDCLLVRVEQMRGRLDEICLRPPFRKPLERIRDLERKLDDWSERLGRGTKQRLAAAAERVAAGAARLESLSPLNVLARGYSLTRREADQAVVRDSSQVRPGDRLLTVVQHGRIVSRVEQAEATLPTQGSTLASRCPHG
jgi:exodeoxyribonuclease VII large subunit